MSEYYLPPRVLNKFMQILGIQFKDSDTDFNILIYLDKHYKVVETIKDSDFINIVKFLIKFDKLMVSDFLKYYSLKYQTIDTKDKFKIFNINSNETNEENEQKIYYKYFKKIPLTD